MTDAAQAAPSRVAFIGLGNMGRPMALNLRRGGHAVVGFDVAAEARAALAAAGGEAAPDLAAAVAGAASVVTMLPQGAHVREAYLGPGGILAGAAPGALLIDCSTIDVATARAVHAAAAASGRPMLDAPVSGGTAGAAAATLTFMVGGEPAALEQGRPLLAAMGRTIVHAGGPGTGQAAKICNNMILGISMIAVSEAFALGERLGLDPAKLFAISSASSGQCWSMTSYCPVPGPVPAAPANRGYAPGFTTAMMLKDLRLAQEAALAAGVPTPLGAEACQLYALFAERAAGLDFSAIITMFRREIA
jgi:3-hydroxyisobutyrate dehydrogenase